VACRPTDEPAPQAAIGLTVTRAFDVDGPGRTIALVWRASDPRAAGLANLVGKAMGAWPDRPERSASRHRIPVAAGRRARGCMRALAVPSGPDPTGLTVTRAFDVDGPGRTIALVWRGPWARGLIGRNAAPHATASPSRQAAVPGGACARKAVPSGPDPTGLTVTRAFDVDGPGRTIALVWRASDPRGPDRPERSASRHRIPVAAGRRARGCMRAEERGEARRLTQHLSMRM
jgi:hypothetical protein